MYAYRPEIAQLHIDDLIRDARHAHLVATATASRRDSARRPRATRPWRRPTVARAVMHH